MKFRVATMDDKLRDVYLVYGVEIDKKILLPKELEKFVFYLDGERYIGGDFNFLSGIADLMAFTFDNEWFIGAINNFLIEHDKNNIIPKFDPKNTQVMISYVTKVEENK